MCYCHALPRIDTRTRVVILQHPRERDMPIGTARMASLCLPRAELHVGIRWAGEPLASALGDPERPPILLYPGPGARDILRDPPLGPVTLVVVDGTWSQARTVVRDNPVLQALPRYAFATPEPSQYRIRREPRAEYVSTIEALMHVLGVLEGEPARFRSLLDPLRAMVDAQLLCQAEAPRRRLRHPRRAAPTGPAVPAAIIDRFDDLVCVVGEPNAWPYRARGSATRPDAPGARPAVHPDAPLADRSDAPVAVRPEELVHWVAHRVATGETFDPIVAPDLPLSPSTAFHIQIDEATLRAGAPRGALAARFAQFTRPGDILCAWGHYGLALAGESGVALGEQLDLRAAAQRLTNRKFGSLEGYAESIAPLDAPLTPGRAGRRLAALVQIVRAWRALVDDTTR